MTLRLAPAVLALSLCSPLFAQTEFSQSLSIFKQQLDAQAVAVPTPSFESVDKKSASCTTYSLTVKLKGRTVTLPATGLWTLESHLATQDDSFPGQHLFPETVTENITQHLDRACELLKKLVPGTDCNNVYRTTWEKEWTPPENGLAGQGSVGDLKPSSKEEMWVFNMMWIGDSVPKPGTKFLASYNGKNVVVVGGYETGPASSKFLGGFQREVLWYLGATEDSSKVKLSALKNQSLPPGPVTCSN
jgi:hypothetical protein